VAARRWPRWKTGNKSGRKNSSAEFDLTVTPSKSVTVRLSPDYYKIGMFISFVNAIDITDKTTTADALLTQRTLVS
jgi:hypothetical protein